MIPWGGIYKNNIDKSNIDMLCTYHWIVNGDWSLLCDT